MDSPRIAKYADKVGIKALWLQRFGEEDGFADFMFSERYIPEYSVCIEDDGKIVSALQSIPQNINIRNVIIPCTIIAGVSTDENYSGRGLMSQAFKYYMEYTAQLGVCITVHTPAKLPTFFSKGHLPATDVLKLKIANASGKTVLPSATIGEMYRCYFEFSKNYSGIIARSYPDFVLKMMDYESTGGKNIAVYKDNSLSGYAVYFDKDKVYGEEIAALDDKTYALLIDALSHIANGRSLECKLAPNANVYHPNATIERAPKGVAGIASVSALLKRVFDIDDYSIELTDKIVSENNGCFDMCGRRTKRKPQIKISSGHLMQLIEGYKDITELQESDEIEICDKGILTDFEKIFSKQTCFIFDEY